MIGRKVNRTRVFAGNALWSLALQLVTIVVGFLVPRTIIDIYGSAANGLVTSLTQMVGYIVLVEAGISTAAIFSLYEPLARGDSRQVSVIVSAARIFYYKSGAVFVLLAILLALLYPRFVDCVGFTADQVALLVLSLSASGVLDFFTLAKYRVLLTADQRNWIIQMATIVYKIVYTVIVLILASHHASLVVVYLVAIFPVILRTMVLSGFAKRRYPEIDFNAKVSGYRIDQRWDAFFLQMLNAVQSGFPIIIVSFLIGNLDLVSVFSVYLLVANGIQQLCGVVTNGTQAVFGEVIARRDVRVLRKSYQEMGVLMGIIDAVASGVTAIMIVPFVLLYVDGVTDVSYYAPVLGILMAINVFLYHLKTPEGLLVISAGKYHESRPYVFVQTLILVVGATLGACFGGLNGVMVGVCASNVYAAVYLVFFVPARICQIQKRTIVKRYLISIAAFAPSVLMACAQLVYAPTWATWLETILIIALACVGWAICVFYIADRSVLLSLFDRVRKVLFRER